MYLPPVIIGTKYVDLRVVFDKGLSPSEKKLVEKNPIIEGIQGQPQQIKFKYFTMHRHHLRYGIDEGCEATKDMLALWVNNFMAKTLVQRLHRIPFGNDCTTIAEYVKKMESW